MRSLVIWALRFERWVLTVYMMKYLSKPFKMTLHKWFNFNLLVILKVSKQMVYILYFSWSRVKMGCTFYNKIRLVLITTWSEQTYFVAEFIAVTSSEHNKVQLKNQTKSHEYAAVKSYSYFVTVKCSLSVYWENCSLFHFSC